MSSLFRREALDNSKFRLQGDIALFQPLPTVILTGLVGVIALVVLGWLLFGSYARSETVQGVVVEDSDIAYVVPQRPGLLIRLFAGDDQLVRAGQPLAIVQTEADTASGTHPSVETLRSLVEQQRQSDLQLHLVGRIDRENREKLQITLAGAQQKVIELDSEIRLQQQIIASLHEAFQLLGPVMERGFVSRNEYEARRQAYLSAQQQLNSLQERRTDSAALLAETRTELARAPLDRQNGEAAQRSAIEALKQEQLKASQASSYLITAPVNGRITAVQGALGRYVDGSKPLLTITPVRSRFAVEVFAPSKAAGFLRRGQEVQLMFNAFPYQKYGSFGGHIVRIAHSIVRPEQLDAPLKVEEPVYRVRVGLDDATLARSGRPVRLQAGMTLEASIVLDRRTFLEWLLEPIASVQDVN